MFDKITKKKIIAWIMGFNSYEYEGLTCVDIDGRLESTVWGGESNCLGLYMHISQDNNKRNK